MKIKSLVYWIVRMVAAIIMLQTLYFKFSGAEESVYRFSTVGMEPWGRIGGGIFELLASILILFNATAWIGACIALGLMGGAISMHLTILGISVRGDHGQLFYYAVTVALCSLVILYFNRDKILSISKSILTKG